MTGIHQISVDFCNCDKAEPHRIQLLRLRLFPSTTNDPKTAATFDLLKTFQMLSFMSKVSVYEFYQTLSRLTNNVGVPPPVCPDPFKLCPETNSGPTKNRYPALLRMIHEWRHIRMLKRAGRGHDGIGATKLGECAVLCPACPHPGINLPKKWETAPAHSRYAFAVSSKNNVANGCCPAGCISCL